eukprot:UN11688
MKLALSAAQNISNGKLAGALSGIIVKQSERDDILINETNIKKFRDETFKASASKGCHLASKHTFSGVIGGFQPVDKKTAIFDINGTDSWLCRIFNVVKKEAPSFMKDCTETLTVLFGEAVT